MKRTMPAIKYATFIGRSLLTPRDPDSAQVRQTGAQGELESGEAEQPQERAGNRGPRQPPHPGVARRRARRFRWQVPFRREAPIAAADATDLRGDGVGDGLQLAATAGAVAASIAQQKAEVVDLEDIGRLRGIVARQQLLDILKERLTGNVDAEQLLLERPPGPLGEERITDRKSVV